MKTLQSNVVILLGACATNGEMKSSAMPDLPEALTIQAAGPRCDAQGQCQCRQVDMAGRSDRGVSEAPITAGSKRFELRTVRSVDPTSITVENRGTLHKTTVSAEANCAYIDLPPGKHRVRFTAKAAEGEGGMSTGFFISEYGEKMQDWYDTFRFRCGDPDACKSYTLADELKRIQAVPRGLHDPCGSVKVESVRYAADHAANQNVTDLTVDLTLNVYDFPPRFAHRNDMTKCTGIAAP